MMSDNTEICEEQSENEICEKLNKYLIINENNDGSSSNTIQEIVPIKYLFKNNDRVYII